MPVYEYQCKACSRDFEYQQRMSDPDRTVCEACGGALDRLISRTAFSLKGGGWYKDLYASTKPEAKSEGGESKSNGDAKAAPKADAPAASDAKPAAKADAGSTSGSGTSSGGSSSGGSGSGGSGSGGGSSGGSGSGGSGSSSGGSVTKAS